MAIISTIKEKDDTKKDLEVAFNLLGDVAYEFKIEEDMYEATEF